MPVKFCLLHAVISYEVYWEGMYVVSERYLQNDVVKLAAAPVSMVISKEISKRTQLTTFHSFQSTPLFLLVKKFKLSDQS